MPWRGWRVFLDVRFESADGPCDLARVALPGGRVAWLVRPLSFMNRSGEVLSALPELPADPADLLVVCDDLSLPPGRLRLRLKGSDGGHRGLRSVEAALGSRNYPRLRIGVGEPPAGTEVVDYVLERPPRPEAAVLEKAAFVAALGVVTWLDSAPMGRLMSCLNRRGV